MPIYEYRCASCGAELEKLQKISDQPLLECPECGKPALEKQVSVTSFRLKGSGWYETDFKTGKKKHGVAETDSKTAPASGEGGDKAAAKEGGEAGAGKDRKESVAKPEKTDKGASTG